MYDYWAEVIEVIDGDTMWLRIDQGFGDSTVISGRFALIDTHEIRGRLGKKGTEERRLGMQAKAFVEDWVNKHNRKVYVTSEKPDTEVGAGKYSRRWIVRIWDSPEMEDELGVALVKAGHFKTHSYSEEDLAGD